ncbi:MAG: cobalt ECF transporter T component CbiQ [Bryobacter sp.]|nr:cobalt ECF transporter T component CbiQ [Bryobacter sp.]
MSLLGHHHAHHASPIHRLSAGAKLSTALALILGTVLIPEERQAWFAGVAVFLMLVAALSRISPVFLLKRLLVLSPFVLGVALVNALQPTARVNWREVALRGLLCLATVVLVSNTTPFTEVLRVLRHVRVPALLVTTLALMHRYLFVLADERERMRRARAGRTFARGHRFTWPTLATVAGQLFIRASERAERIYDAMCARGWK